MVPMAGDWVFVFSDGILDEFRESCSLGRVVEFAREKIEQDLLERELSRKEGAWGDKAGGR